MAEFEGYSGDFESANYSDVSGSMEVPTFQGKIISITYSKISYKNSDRKSKNKKVSETDDGFDEPVRETIMRDLREVMNKFKHVISPKKEVQNIFGCL